MEELLVNRDLARRDLTYSLSKLDAILDRYLDSRVEQWGNTRVKWLLYAIQGSKLLRQKREEEIADFAKRRALFA